MTIRASWLIWRFDWNDAPWFEKSVNRLTPFSIRQTTNPLGNRSSSSCLITPVSRVTLYPPVPRCSTASAQNDISLENWIYVSSNALALNPETGESQSRVRSRTGDEKSLWRRVCVRTSPQGYPILQKIMIKILQDHICLPHPSPYF